ncbi:putative ABC transport system ATP-binding protein [Roseimicrobium gellanilyticum]|uniref:Putative ABC transport system ATP-binding protein n=1 Tax=Roseimicrobium gellanilyticum TaxID=748857 RepID=A0A366HW04_9BACT|nr:ABC transporter ATP-binding protein [Roseimicrobium gellanilyticum]RBP47764.1 putative ABC transport system ATP-binding protein [Roseimicrobium gellanilyticum]
MPPPFIQCRGLTKSYKKGTNTVTPLQDLDLDVPRGSFLALMGPSGSGKTTLLNLIAGIDSPTSGTLRIGEAQLERMSRSQLTKWRATHVGYIFQLYHLVPILSAFENVELPLLLSSLSRSERRARVQTALQLVGLADRAHHIPAELSGGQEQRVAIARAIVANPALLVADEPTGDLDRESADSILSLLRELVALHGKTVVMVTHDPRAADAADRVLHLEKGRLLESQSHRLTHA